MMTQRDWLLISGGVVAGLAIAIGFPKARRQIGPLIAETGQRAGSMLSGIAEMVAAQMEQIEDLAATQRANSTEPNA